jgi:hypothetical protein
MDMRKRAMSLSAAMFGGAVAGLTLAAIPETSARADDCLAAPDRQAEQGSQWRYRIDRATNRHCWYVKSDDQEAAPLASSPSKPVATPTGVALRRSITNARAELAPVQETVQPADGNGLSMADIVESDITAGNAPLLREPAGRRPDNTDAMDLAEAPPSSMVTGPRHRPQPAFYKQAGHHGSIRTLLSALVGAMVLVGGATAVVTKFGRKAIGRHKKRGRERAIWNARPGTKISAPVRGGDEAAMDWIRIARQNEEASLQAEQIEQLLSRAARRSTV